MGHASYRSRHRYHHDAWGHRGHWEKAWFGGPPWAGGRRARRGDVRTGLLSLLSDKPMHGYDLIRELEERSGGAWRPSPGSIYPTLQLLEDEGLVTSEEQDGKRVYTITDAGRALLQEKGPSPAEPERPESEDLRGAFMQLAQAVRQAVGVTPPEQHAKLREILVNARREVYKLLAETD